MPIRDDSAGSYGTWNDDDLSWIDWLKANASDGGNALANLGRNLVDGFSPIGTSEQGNMALQVPPFISGFADSYQRVLDPENSGSYHHLTGVPEFDAPIHADTNVVLQSLYGGNAVSGLASGASKAAARPRINADWDGSFGGYTAYAPDGRSAAYADVLNRGDGLEISNITSFPEYRGQGYARSIVDRVMSEADGIPVRVSPMTDDGRGFFASNYRVADDGSLTALSDTGKPSILGSAMAGSSADLASPAASAITQPPIRAYSGTFAEPFGTFKEGPWMSTNPDVAGMYAGTHMLNDPLWNKTTGRIYPVEINPQNPFTVPRGEPINESLTRLGVNPKVFDGSIADAAREKGHDFAIYDIAAGQDGPWAHLQYQALKPNTVRSATTGETLFSDNRPSLLGSALATAGENYDLPEWLRF